VDWLKQAMGPLQDRTSSADGKDKELASPWLIVSSDDVLQGIPSLSFDDVSIHPEDINQTQIMGWLQEFHPRFASLKVK